MKKSSSRARSLELGKASRKAPVLRVFFTDWAADNGWAAEGTCGLNYSESGLGGRWQLCFA